MPVTALQAPQLDFVGNVFVRVSVRVHFVVFICSVALSAKNQLTILLRLATQDTFCFPVCAGECETAVFLWTCAVLFLCFSIE